MIFEDISVIAAIVGGIAFWVIGALWYGPILGKPWRRLIGVPADAKPQAPSPQMMVGALCCALVINLLLAVALGSDISWYTGLWGGAVFGALAGGAFLGNQYIFEGRTWPLYFINVGYYAVGCAVAGLLTALIQ